MLSFLSSFRLIQSDQYSFFIVSIRSNIITFMQSIPPPISHIIMHFPNDMLSHSLNVIPYTICSFFFYLSHSCILIHFSRSTYPLFQSHLTQSNIHISTLNLSICKVVFHFSSTNLLPKESLSKLKVLYNFCN